MLTQDVCNFYKCLAVYDDYGGIVDSEEEGKNIAKSLGKRNKVGSTFSCFSLICLFSSPWLFKFNQASSVLLQSQAGTIYLP
jgi:hypothetical protein